MSEPEVPTGPLVPTTPEIAGANAASPGLPQQIDRYRVERLLGKGGFGKVYLAHDEQLHRPVTTKVRHRECISWPEDVEAYIAEARSSGRKNAWPTGFESLSGREDRRMM